MKKIFKGDLRIEKGDKTDYSELEEVTGFLYIHNSADLKNLKSVGSSLYIYSSISINLAKNLWVTNRKDVKKIWIVTNLCPEWLIKRVSSRNNTQYYIGNTQFDLEWFNKIRKGKLSAEEVFAIDNIEHRRVAYEMMDKSKMKELKNYKVLDESIDEKGKPVKIISFNVQNMNEDLIFYNCVDASTDREYFLQTEKKTWKKAKDASFGLENVEWLNEW